MVSCRIEPLVPCPFDNLLVDNTLAPEEAPIIATYTVPALPPLAWYERPVALSLHPVGPGYGTRYQAILQNTMGGRKASTVWSPTVAAADVYWRFVELDGRGTAIDQDTAKDWRNVATAGATIASVKVIEEAVERGEGVKVVWTAVSLVMGPSLTVAPRSGVALGASGSKASQGVARSDLLDTTTRRPPPAFRTGVGWHFRDSEAPDTDPFLDYAAWLSVDRLIVDTVRLDWLVHEQEWSATAKENVKRGWSLFATLKNERVDDTVEGPAPLPPTEFSYGVTWVVPDHNRLTFRLERTFPLGGEGGPGLKLTVKAERGSPVPGRPHLGQRTPDGASLPLPPPRGPNATARIVD